jgi:hypothetical protein
MNRRNLWIPWRPIGIVVLGLSCGAFVRAQSGQSSAVGDEALSQLAAIEPIDTHLHAYQDVPAIADLFSRLNLRALNVLLIDDRDPFAKSMEPQWIGALAVHRLTKGRAAVCTTIDPYDLESPGFAARVNKRLNADFDAGAIAVKLYKVVGMQIRRKDGTYVLPDDAAFRPISTTSPLMGNRFSRTSPSQTPAGRRPTRRVPTTATTTSIPRSTPTSIRNGRARRPSWPRAITCCGCTRT